MAWIEFPVPPEKKDIPKSAGFKWVEDRGVWRGPLTVQSANILQGHVNGEIGEKIDKFLEEFDYDKGVVTQLRDIQPMNHQVDGASFIRDVKNAGIFYDMGTGKTVTVLLALQELWVAKKITHALILAPLPVIPEWEKQIKDFMSVRTYLIRIHHYNKDKKIEKVKKFQQVRDRLSIGILNYASLDPLMEHMVKRPPDLICADESTKIKSRNSKMHKAATRLSDMADYSVILTGTPTPNRVDELYGQVRFLSKDYFGGSYWRFAKRYCKFGGFQGKKIVGEQRTDELKEVLDQFTLRVTKEEVLDLPEKTYTTWEVELRGKQKAAYEEAKEEFIFAIEAIGEGRRSEDQYYIEIQNALSRMAYCQRIASGHIREESGEVVRFKNNAKENALMDFLEEIGDQPLVVSARFREDIEIIADAINSTGKRAVKFHGGVPSHMCERNLKEFQNGNVDAFVMQVQKGGYGLNLTVSPTILIWNNWFSFGVRDQLEARIHRKGQTRNCHFVDFVAKGTVDEDVLEAIRKKEKISQALFGVDLDIDEETL